MNIDSEPDTPSAELPAPRSVPSEETSAPRLIYRARTGRLFAGVCTGLARSLDLDVGYVRTLTTLSCFIGGAGFIAYALAVLLLPVEPRSRGETGTEVTHEPEDVSPPSVDLISWGGAVFLGLGSLLASRLDFLQFHLLSLSTGAIWPALVLALTIGLVEWRRRTPTGLHAVGFVRPRHDRILFGLASGYARWVSLDPNLVRIALAVITLWSLGLGLLLYLVLATFVPEEGG